MIERYKKSFASKPVRILWQGLLLVIGFSSLHVSAQDEPDTALSEAAALERSQELSLRKQALETLQGEFGIYDPVLIEAYSDFGAYYSEVGEHAAAAEQYSSAWQVARISTGLFSVEQIPVLQRLIESYRNLGNWEEVDKFEHLRYHIGSRVYEKGDEAFLLAATAYGDWKLRVVRENLLDLNSRALSSEIEDLSRFYSRTIADLEMNTDTTQEEMLQMIYGKSLADVALARMVASTPYTAFQGTVSQYINQTRCQNVVNSQGQVVRQCYNVQIENPQYRQSQQIAKEMAVTQSAREVVRSVEKLQAIALQSTKMTLEQRQALESHIGELQTETALLQRSSRRSFLF